MLFVKGFIIGLGKIIPGVSGALLAINFGIYDKLLMTITNFFDHPKDNIKFLLQVSSGILLAIILGSKLILLLFTNYKFITMMFFIGLMIGGTYKFARQLKYSFKRIIFVLTIVILFLIISLIKCNITSIFHMNILYFIGGYIEIFSAIVPGISGTSLLMIMGIYDKILELIANVYNYHYILVNSFKYFSYGIGMILSFIINCYLISYLLKKYQNTSYLTILGLSVGSIILLMMIIFKLKITFMKLIVGLFLFMLGIMMAIVLAK